MKLFSIKNLLIFSSIYLTSFILIFFLGYDSIPNQEGYFEISWNMTYLNFSKYLLDTITTPLNYLIVYAIDIYSPLSHIMAWKIMDYGFASLSITFLYYLLAKNYESHNIRGLLFLLSQFYLLYAVTGMTGEGPAVFFTLLGIYCFQQKKYLLSTLFLILSFFSKYTFFLVMPGLLINIILNWKNTLQNEKKKIIYLLISLALIFVFYNSLKSGRDIAGQLSYMGLELYRFLYYAPRFILVVTLLSPIPVLFFVSNINKSNLFVPAIVGGVFIMLSFRYYYWHYPYQIIIWIIYFLVSSKEFIQKINYKVMLTSILWFMCLYSQLPIKSDDISLIPKHSTFAELDTIGQEIQKDYHGGKVGYYMNRPFNEPFDGYEISYISPSWDFQLKATEYVVLPKDHFPPILKSFEKCHYEYQKTFIQNALYKVTCNFEN